MMAKRYDDPLFVLAVLNSLGFINVNAKVLKDFMKDLKTHRKKKEKAHKAWKRTMIRKVIAYNRKDMEDYMIELQNKQDARPVVTHAVDNHSDEQSQHPRQLSDVAEVYHRDQSFDDEKSVTGKPIQKLPFRTEQKSLVKTPEATRKNRTIQPNLTDPSSSGKGFGNKSRDQSEKILETDPKKQQTIQYDFDIATEDSDSYLQLPEQRQTKKKDGRNISQSRKHKTLFEKSFNEHLFDSKLEVSDSYKTLPKLQEKTDARKKSQTEKPKGSLKQTLNTDFSSSFEQSDSYKTLPKPQERKEAREKFQTEKSKVSLKKTDNEDFPSSLEVSDSYKQLPGAKEKIDSQFKSRGAGRGTFTLGNMFDQDFPSSLEASDSYKQIARKPRDQGEDKSREKFRRDRTADKNVSPRRDKSNPIDKQMSATLEEKDKSKSVEEKSQSEIYENLIESGLNYSDFQRNVTQGKSSSLKKVHLDQNSPEQFSLKDLRERSNLDYDFSGSTEPSQRANRVETDRNLVTTDRAVERSQLASSRLEEVTLLRFDDSDSESDSESNYLEQPEAVRPSEEVKRMVELQKSQSSTQSTPNFRQHEVNNYDNSSKSDSESISQVAARNRKEEIVKTGKTPARSGRFKPGDFSECSILEY